MSERLAKRLALEGRTNDFGFMFIMRSTLLLLLFVLVLPLACGNDDGDPVGPSSGANSQDGVPTPELVCPAYASDAYPEMAPLVVEKASYAPVLNGSFSVSPTGSPRYSIPIEVPPGRRLAPQLEVVVDNGGVSIAGLSSIHRCGANLAQDGELRGVQLSPGDHYCLNGSRLIQIGTGSDSIGAFAEYRTWPDSNTKILGYGAAAADGFDVTYFVAYSPNGTISHFGTSQTARVLWRGVTRSWNIDREMDRCGNTIRYDHASLTNGAKDATTREMVIDKIWYAGFVNENGVETLGDQVVDFEYDDDDRYGKLFYEGEEVADKTPCSKQRRFSGGES